jgi:RHS repeat-associated protein
LVGGQTLTDPDPAATAPAYARGDFDGWLIQAVVTDGTLTIAPAATAVDAKLCFVEIGRVGTAPPATTEARLAQAITAASDRTGGAPFPTRQPMRAYVHGTYVDEVLAYVTGTGANHTRYYPHANHLYSVAALTDGAGQVVERYTYNAYGTQTITSANGVVRQKGAVGFDRGFTGYVADNETGLLHARTRAYSSAMGGFLARDMVRTNYWRPLPGDGYNDGMSLYRGWFAPNDLDPYGTKAAKEQGAKAIRDSAEELKKECACCVEQGKVDLCKEEAVKVTEALAKMWEDNWGNGPLNDNDPGSDSVGGYLCWDWANAFKDAADSVPATIWENSYQMFEAAPTPQGTPVHFAVKINIKNPKAGHDCDGFSYDDGFFDGDLIHGQACKKNKDWPAPGSGYNPVPPGQSAPPKYGLHPVMPKPTP